MTTQANAEAIRELTRDADDHIRAALQALTDAERLAEGDYEHSADKLHDVIGALRLISGTVAGQYHTWNDYARARAVGALRKDAS